MQTPSNGLNRRELMGAAAAAGLAATSGLSLAWSGGAAPVVSVHLDVPYANAHGGQTYRAPIRSAAEVGLIDTHALA